MISLDWLTDTGLRVSALILLGGLLVRTVSRRPAALRHLAWTLALAAALLAPLLVRVMPLQLPLIPAPRGVVEPAEPEAGPVTDGGPTVNESTDPGQVPLTPLEPVAPPSSKPLTLTGLAPLLWLSVAALLGLRLLGSFVALARIARRARPLETSDWPAQLARGCERLGLNVRPRLLMTERISIPCIAGWLRPVILLPPSARDWSPDRREVVLLHELAHLKRGDIVAHLFGQTACMIHWFNPLVWIAARRQRADAEQACDDLVIGSGARPSEYAGHLLEIVQSSPIGRAPVAVLPMAIRSEFEGRLLAILESKGVRHMPRLRAAMVGILFSVSAILPIAAASAPAASPRQMDETDEEYAPVQQSGDRESLELLAGALNDSVASVRAAAAQALGSMRDTLAVRALMEALRRDTDAEVRRNAAWALGQIEDGRAVPALSDALRSDADAEVRRAAAEALGSIEDPRAVPALVEALQRNEQPELRRAVIDALGSIEDKSVVPALIPALKDQDPEIRRAAADALGSIEDTRAVGDLMNAARDEDPEVRRAVIDALGSLEDRRAAPTIARALSDQDVEVRRAAANAMGSLDDLRQVPRELIAALSDSDSEVRQNAVQAMDNFEDPAAVAPLIALLKDPDVEIRRAVVEALEDIDDPAALRALREALRDEDPEVRRRAAQALGNRASK
jgi:HEAT repeat protein/beta-lactamase regulating signal transducer with metallopeptidase domain